MTSHTKTQKTTCVDVFTQPAHRAIIMESVVQRTELSAELKPGLCSTAKKKVLEKSRRDKEETGSDVTGLWFGKG